MDKNIEVKQRETLGERASEAKERIYVKTKAKINEEALRVKLRVWRSVAAASIILLCIAGGMNLKKGDAALPILVESKSPAGSTTRFTLSDGTVVALNASSSISYPMRFEGKNRSVQLDGEAYFEVTKDSKHPFVVETNGMKINVLGTTFNVRSYKEDNRAITTLLEGSVSVDTEPGKQLALKPGQQLVYDKASRKTEIKNVNADLYVSWKDGQCYFDKEKFIHIAKILERHFGVEIVISSPALENQIFSGYFSRKEGVQQILNSFRKHRNFDYKLNDTGIEIYEK